MKTVVSAILPVTLHFVVMALEQLKAEGVKSPVAESHGGSGELLPRAQKVI